jgi:hypothetical protein
MWSRKLHVVVAIFCIIAHSQLSAENASDVFYITEQEAKVGMNLNFLNELGSCQKPLKPKKAGCCFDNSKFIELGKTIKFKDIEFECVGFEPDNLPDTIETDMRISLTKYEWISKKITNYCGSIHLSLNECEEKVEFKIKY